MKLTAKLKEQTLINPNDMKDGDVAVIVQWPSGYIGYIVMKLGEDLIQVGKPSGTGWPKKGGYTFNGCLVRLLGEGDVIEFTNF